MLFLFISAIVQGSERGHWKKHLQKPLLFLANHTLPSMFWHAIG